MELTNTVGKWFGIIIGIVVLFGAMAVLIPDAQTAGDSINTSANCDWNGSAYVDCDNLPFASFFTSGGLIFLVIMAGLLFGVYKMISKGK